MSKNKNRYEIVIYGRGGQGAKTTAELLVQAAQVRGKYVQAFPQFGPERSGAPISTYVRISDDPIRVHEPIVDPDCVLVLDESILENVMPIENFGGSEPLIVNSKKTKNDLVSEYGLKGNVVSIDASGLALDIIGENRPNSIILGKFAFVTEVVKIEDIANAFKEKYLGKLGQEKVNKNIEAITRAYESH